VEVVGAAAARAICLWGGVTRSSFPHLLAGAFVVEAATTSEQRGAAVAGGGETL
jgi:hypothetical protein